MHLSFTDMAGFDRLFSDARDKISLFLREMLRWNRETKLLSFVGGLITPQQNAMGRLLPRHDIRNFVYLTEQLNAHLEEEIHKYHNVYYVDMNQIVSSIGRRYVQDDSVCIGSHGGLLSDFDYAADQQRIAPVGCMTETYETRVREFVLSVWAELKAMYRTVRQIDGIKLIIVDLDDTLWRGVVAEAGELTGEEMSGWPLGVLEALSYLKKRGVLLAIVSKNEEENIRRLWPKITGGRMKLEDFAFLRINWRPKPDNIAEVIAAANVLPSSVVFVDDNPVERASVRAAYPTIRTIGANQYYIRRLLLWSSETQVATVTDESARRTEMMQAQTQREDERKTLSREDFLRGLDVRIRVVSVNSTINENFNRSFELLNKTNQFNTTGRRWSLEELDLFFQNGGCIMSFFVQDKFTEYGLVGVVLIAEIL
jgi:FkbH-like protein